MGESQLLATPCRITKSSKMRRAWRGSNVGPHPQNRESSLPALQETEEDGENSIGLFSYGKACFALRTKLVQSCLTLCNSPGCTVHGILQARILEWVAMSSSPGIFPTQGLNPRLFHLEHWRAGSLPLVPPEKPFILQKCASFIYVPMRIEDSSWLPNTHTHTHTHNTHISSLQPSKQQTSICYRNKFKWLAIQCLVFT